MEDEFRLRPAPPGHMTEMPREVLMRPPANLRRLNRLKRGAIRNARSSKAGGSSKYAPRRNCCMVAVRRCPGEKIPAYGVYMMHEAKVDHGRAFDSKANDLDAAQVLKTWGEDFCYRIVISPDNANGVDLAALTREVMAELERSVGKPLQWTATIHRNTDHPHVHVALRGTVELSSDHTRGIFTCSLSRNASRYCWEQSIRQSFDIKGPMLGHDNCCPKM